MLRCLLCLLLAVPTLGFAAPPALPLVETSRSPFAKLSPVGVEQARWTGGLLSERYEVCRTQTIPSMWRLMRDSTYKPFLEHFQIAAGQAQGDYHGAPWNDGDFYKWIEAACSTLAVEHDAALAAAIETAVDAVVAAQREDGYLHTPVLIRQVNGDTRAQPFSDRNDFEVYNLGHLMTAGCVHHRVTGKRNLLNAGEKAAQFLEQAFANPTNQMARQAVCPSHYMGLLELYRTTNDKRYLKLAQRVLDLRNVAAGVEGGGGDDNQDRIPFVEQREAVGHAVRANYLFAGAADLYLETGDQRLETPLEAVWQNVVDKKLYVTGACGALYDGASPDASPEQRQITRIHQAYGRNYQLPSITAHNETCAAVGAMMWNWRRFLANGQGRHIDWLELSLYNAVLSGISLDGDKYLYTNPLRVVDNPPTPIRWSRQRVPFIVSFCCPPNVARVLAQTGGYAYSTAPGELWVNLYGQNQLQTTLDQQSLQIEQQTQYPWEGHISLRFKQSPSTPVALKLRIPGWCENYTVKVNGSSIPADQVDGYVALQRIWQAGDQVTLELDMPVVMLESHPLVEETRNQLAVKRGPIVYCLESTDLADGASLNQVGVSTSSVLKPHFLPNLLGGVTVLEGELPIRQKSQWNSLYRSASSESTSTTPCRLVPYYAWGNRGQSEMSVWLPRR